MPVMGEMADCHRLVIMRLLFIVFFFQVVFSALSVDQIKIDIEESLMEAQKLLDQEVLDEIKDQNEVAAWNRFQC